MFLFKVLWLSLVAFVKFFIPSNPKKDLSQEIVLVTGAASGIGRLMSLRCAGLHGLNKIKSDQVLIRTATGLLMKGRAWFSGTSIKTPIKLCWTRLKLKAAELMLMSVTAARGRISTEWLTRYVRGLLST